MIPQILKWVTLDSLMLKARSPTIATWLAFALKALSFILLYPFIFRAYSAQEIAFWLSTGLTATLISLIDIGITPTFVRLLAYGLSTHDSESIAVRSGVPTKIDIGEVLGTLRYLYRVMTTLAFVVALGIAWWIGQGQGFTKLTLVGWGLVVASSTSIFWGLQYQAWLQATNRIAEMRLREVKIYGAALFFSVIFAILHTPILAIVSANAAAAILLTTANSVAARKLFKEQWEKPIRYASNIGKIALTSSWRTGVGISTSYGLQQGVMAWYASTASPQATASFLLTMRLFQAISQIAQAPFYTKLPILAGLYARQDIHGLAKTAALGAKHSALVLAIAATTMIIIGPAALHWTRSTATMMPLLWLVIAYGALVLERSGAILLQIYTTTNTVHWHWINGITASIACISGFVSWTLIGTLSIPLAWLIANAFFYLPVCFLLSAKLIGKDQSKNTLVLLLAPNIVSLSAIGVYKFFFN